MSEPNNIQAISTKIKNNITNNLSEHASNEYHVFFERNMGIFSESDQDNIRKARIVVVGTSGIGGTISTILTRTGVSNFMLIDPDRYEPTNMNRQVSCFTDTIGKYEVEVLKRDILRIKPEAHVEIHNRSLSLEEIKGLIKDWDEVVAEANDLAYSSKVLYMAQEMKKFAATAMPSGYLGCVMSFPPIARGEGELQAKLRAEETGEIRHRPGRYATIIARETFYSDPRYRYPWAN